MHISGNNYVLSQSGVKHKDQPKLPDMLLGSNPAEAKVGQSSASLVQTAEQAKATAKAKNDKAIADFNDYMNQSTMEKYAESWLARHGITKEQFDRMSGEEKEKITNQMKEDIEREAKQAVEKQRKPLSILV